MTGSAGAGVRRGPDPVQRRLRRLRAGADGGRADRRAGGAGRRRGDRHAAQPDHLDQPFPAAERGAMVGIWGGIAGLAVAGGPLVGGAVVQGLSWHWIFWVNVPIGFAAAIVVRPAAAGEPRPGAAARPARAGADRRRIAGAHVGFGPGRRSGWSDGYRRHPAGGRHRAAGRVRPARAGRRRPHGAAAAVPQPDVHRGQCRRVPAVRRDLLRRVPHHRVLPARAGLRAAGHRPAAAAVDRDAHDRRAAGRGACRPDRHQAAAGHRAGAAGGRAGVVRSGRPAAAATGSSWRR